jgi:general secretion pathway protein C
VGLSELADKLVEPARWIIIMGIAFTLANTVLFFIAPPERSGAAGSAARQAVSAPDTRPAVSINAILNRNLFGEAGETTATDTGLPAVETRLPLELLGVFVADEPEDSAAIVAQKGKTGLLYVVGEKVPGNAELLEVHADHIVLRRAGIRETLRFPQVASSTPVAVQAQPTAAPRGATGSVQPAAEPETPRDFVASYRDRIEADPEGTLREIGITPVSEGNPQGYRLDSAAASSPYLSQTGLQPGDVVLSVNGQPVGNIQQDRHQLDNILAEGSARIEVQRGTRRFFVTASLNQ